MTTSVVPAVVHDVATAAALLAEFFSEICYVRVAPAHWAPDADLHPSASLFYLYALVVSFITGQYLLLGEVEELSDEAPVETLEAEKESDSVKLPSRPPPVSRDLIRAFRRKMKETSKRKAGRFQTQLAQLRSRAAKEGPVGREEEEVELAPSVQPAPAPRYVDAGMQTDVSVGATPEPVSVTEPEPVTGLQATVLEAEPLEVASPVSSASVAEEAEESDDEGDLGEESVGSSLDQLWGGPNGVSEDGERGEESAILGDEDSQGMESEDEGRGYWELEGAILVEEDSQGVKGEEEEEEERRWAELGRDILWEENSLGMEEEEEEPRLEDSSSEADEPSYAPIVGRVICQPRSRMARLGGSQLEALRGEQERLEERMRERMEKEKEEREKEEQVRLEREREEREREEKEREEREKEKKGKEEKGKGKEGVPEQPAVQGRKILQPRSRKARMGAKKE
ncbi:hypothetical protein TWF718_006261 [Orbilia javanica]|uniref:Uncharacterized protein n=1 Tax=Orbilia javanica TaxID=47235 RepID=A0AAN8MQY7_9PEZI